MKVLVLILFSLVAGGLASIVPTKHLSLEANTVQTDAANSGEDSKETWIDFWDQFLDNIENAWTDIWDQFLANDTDSFEVTWTNYWDTVLGNDMESSVEGNEFNWEDFFNISPEQWNTLRHFGWLSEMDKFLGEIANIYNHIKEEILAYDTESFNSWYTTTDDWDTDNYKSKTDSYEYIYDDEYWNLFKGNVRGWLSEMDEFLEHLSKHSLKTAQQFGIRLLKCFSEPEGDSNKNEEHPIPRKCIKEQIKSLLK